MSTSTIPAALDALLAMARAAAPAAVKVVDGFPRFAIVNTDLIAVGGKAEPTASGRQTAAALGARRREERYTLRVSCLSARGVGTSQKDVRDIAFTLMGYVETGLRNDPTLGGKVQSAQVDGDLTLFQTEADSADQGTFAEVSFDVSVQARI